MIKAVYVNDSNSCQTIFMGKLFNEEKLFKLMQESNYLNKFKEFWIKIERGEWKRSL